MILAIDQGTTGSTCIVFDEQAQPLGRAYGELSQHFPKPGWVEHDIGEMWRLTRALAVGALADAGIAFEDLAAVGITNQRETVCVWDPVSGEPLHRAIVWQDRRTAGRCEELQAQGLLEHVRERTGLVLDPYFSATKIEWLLANVDGLRRRAEEGRATFGTVDSWLTYKLTGMHVTDVSNASRTLLYDIHSQRWDEELLSVFGIPERALPRVCASAGTIGEIQASALTDEQPAMSGDAHGCRTVPLAGVAGDQQAALFGQACIDPGMAKSTYGTGSFVLLNSGFVPPTSPPGLLGTTAWAIGEGKPTYALEASIFVTGAAVQWLRDGLGIIERAADTEALAASLQSNDGVYFVPALTGLGSPHWDAHARGTIVGLTRGSGRAHLARATLEAIAYQTVDAVRAMERAAGHPLHELRADGGASGNAWLMQFQADVLGAPVVVPEIAETTALGAACLAGVGVGMWTLSDVAEGWRERARYEPRMEEPERRALLDGWADALARTRGET
ncbi:MAG: glycerol kinase GlpK [Solirubrobacteraceae bacterium]